MKWSKRLALLGAALAVLMLFVLPTAMAETSVVPSVVIGDAAESLIEQLMDTAVSVLPYAATLVALFIGWRIVRRFLSSR